MILREENGAYQFDFSLAEYATDELHEVYKSVPLADVDFIFKHKTYFFVEYKNATINQKAKDSGFDPLSPKKLSNVVRKFYDSLIFVWACNDVAPVQYVYVMECKDNSPELKKLLREKLLDRLPFEFQRNSKIRNKMISGVEVLSIDDWNTHSTYSKFPITKIREDS